MNGYRNASYAGIILSLFGIVTIVYGLMNLSKEKELDQKGLIADGMVYELNVVEPYRQAVVAFTDNKGEVVKFVDKLFWNHSFEKYKIGQQVEVIYDPENPIETATINQFFQRNTAPWWPFLVGTMVIIIGLLMRRSLLKKAKILDQKKRSF